MSLIAIKVKGLGKAYKTYHRQIDRLIDFCIPRANKGQYELKWVLRDVSFSIEAGKALGVIGVNGAGKSTLMKIVAGAVKQTVGNIEICGRVGAILELGVGLNHELTGEENAYLVGQLLGYTRSEIKSLIPHVQEFSELGEYFHHQVRVYSSGMQMRLAFAIATAKRPDVLIVDEALSVGDAYFQHKCFMLIDEFKKLGTAILLVSHDKNAILSICDQAILLNQGVVENSGTPESVMDYYNAILSLGSDVQVMQREIYNNKIQTSSGSGEVDLTSITLLNQEFNKVQSVHTGDLVHLCISCIVRRPVQSLTAGFALKDKFGNTLFGTNSARLEGLIEAPILGESYDFKFTFLANIGAGTYSLSIALAGDNTHLKNNYYWLDLAMVIEVTGDENPKYIGIIPLNPTLAISRNH